MCGALIHWLHQFGGKRGGKERRTVNGSPFYTPCGSPLGISYLTPGPHPHPELFGNARKLPTSLIPHWRGEAKVVCTDKVCDLNIKIILVQLP